jgi:hypothetical protein
MSSLRATQAPSYFRAVRDLLLLLVALGAVGWMTLHREPPKLLQIAAAPPLATAPPKAVPSRANRATPAVEPDPEPALDRVAVGRAEEALDMASRDRARAEARSNDAAKQLEAAELESTKESLVARSLPQRLRDPRAAIARARERGELLRAERDRAKADLEAMMATPRPRRKQLIDKSPVAKPAEGDEYHFEVRRNRVAFIDMERLIDKVKTDARMQIRVSDGRRPIGATVGPVGAFMIHYEMGRSLPESFQQAMESRGVSYNLRSWEIVPSHDVRGETLEAAMHPASDFGRAVNRLNSARATITLWVYPDSFGLYRKLRDLLHSRGFLVAARPLPEGMTIRGSPAGSVSAGQ